MVTTRRTETEFNQIRSQMYEEAIVQYPQARNSDIEAMKTYLAPKKGERILGIGEGNGYFTNSILESIGMEGFYLVTDPSQSQLDNLSRRQNASNLEVQIAGAEEINVVQTSFDKAWSFGAFHHCSNQTQAMKNIYIALKQGGRAVICDVFQGSKLAEHFDTQVARYCNTGHEVKFLSDAFARSLCYLAGFKDENVKIEELPQKWIFDSEHELGDFIYKLHAMTLFPGTEKDKVNETLKGCRDILGIKHKGDKIVLNWPMKCLIAEK